MAEDDRAVGADEPQDRGQRRRHQTDRDRNDVEGRVELGCREALATNFEVVAVEFSNQPHADNDEDDVEQQPRVGQEGIDAKRHENHGIVAREVPDVVVDARLGFGKVGGLRQALEVEEFGEGAQVREPASQRPGSHARDTVLEVQAGRQEVNGDLYPGHLGIGVEVRR